jgi:hypothetical protein
MTSEGYWVNNERIIWNNAVKPCKLCGYCPYGQLVEEFPLPEISRKEAVAHHEYMVKAIMDVVFDELSPDKPLMSKEEAIAETESFNIEDYPEDPLPIDKMRCGVFGHHCPVYYHAELLAEEDPVTQEEINAFDVEIQEYMKKVEEYCNQKEGGD